MSEEEDKLRAELERLEAEDAANAEQQSDEDSATHHHRHHHHHHHHTDGKRKRRKHKSKRKARRRKRILIILLVLFLTAIFVAGVSLYTMYRNGKNQMHADNYNITAPAGVTVHQNGSSVVYNGERYNYNKDVITILFLGTDNKNSAEEARQIGKNHQSDVIVLGAVNQKENKITLINVPRDVMTDVSVYSPSGGYVGRQQMQIALAYAYGDGAVKSCLNSSEAVSRLFYNLPIQTYISLNLDGVAELNDSVGGVDVVSPETIEEFVKGETYHLEGEQASRFVNLRVTDRADANLLRNQRQKEYIHQFLQKFFSATRKNIAVPVDLYNVSKPYCCTNLNPDRITYLATEFVVNRHITPEYINVPVDVAQEDGAAKNYVKEKEFYEMFLDVFYTKA